MAKSRNTKEISGGLTAGLEYGESREVKEMPAAPTVPVQPAPVQPPVVEEKVSLTAGYVYEPQVTETRSETLYFRIKPSIKEKMKKDVQAGQIKSQGDLLNYLVERYYEEKEANKKK